MPHKHADFLEGTVIKQDLDAFARGQFPFLVLLRDSVGTTALMGFFPAIVQFS